MSATVDFLEKEDIETLIGLYGDKRDKIKAQIAELSQSLEGMEKKIYKLTVLVNNNSGGASAQGFPNEGTWNDKIKFVLKNEARPMSSSEIVDKITDYEFSDRKKVMTSVSATLSTATDKIYIKEGGLYRLK